MKEWRYKDGEFYLGELIFPETSDILVEMNKQRLRSHSDNVLTPLTPLEIRLDKIIEKLDTVIELLISEDEGDIATIDERNDDPTIPWEDMKRKISPNKETDSGGRSIMNKQMDDEIKRQFGLTDGDYVEFNKLKNIEYYRLRKLQVCQGLYMQAVVIAGGITDIAHGITDSKKV